MLGVIILDKPPGRSSNQALGALKRLLGGPKLGFVGTLDPLATGVLPVFVGKATKLIPHFEGLFKRYQVTCRLGESTDTLDADGQVTARADIGHLSDGQVRGAILAHQGQQWQTVPRYAAVKVRGVPAYKLARQGQAVPEQQRQVTVWDLEMQQVALPLATFSLSCSAGTYVRSLVHQIGQELG
ncbi:MAG TPA: tRNA pseudouridine(55) synthase TruB, partial [bacterium]|nr:tRNA pseudouridine(55) synthase TruB [bacterium]